MIGLKIEGDATFSVMTWNIYLGADLTPMIAATPMQIPQRVTELFRQFLATNFPSRAKTIANQISLNKPDIIGLQEVAIWELIPPNSNKVVYDFLDILLYELKSKGVEYEVATQNKNAEATLPSSEGNYICLKDRDVILIRKNSDLKITRKWESNFKTNLQVNVIGQTVSIRRGWSAVDISLKGYDFRVVNTHLEPFSHEVQVSQANELLLGPGKTNLPLFFIGDFNSKADRSSTKTYENLIASGFKDIWTISGKGDGFTCCQNPDLLNADSYLNERIDFILLKNNINLDIIEAKLIGDSKESRTKTKLWPSDHAGIIGRFKLNILK
ncbi:endonuclease/exonuclease/phosphatase family protein [Clostridium cylindrosporum]|uniref:Endonuclease/exonuclease/phosphatase n=1 Tax=Clostridium cylindrosporum DSM 605 TaxID=1121307 RepID=A0A0J8DCZ5_CLOCY|nr:endonuclease/exonuclease/phosphatase family protein [Clostridium cylindrosporum]KMT22129.1 endonuclease/exonuclease/phosphatase [Clostridium cylindrosporum DSM 605]